MADHQVELEYQMLKDKVESKIRLLENKVIPNHFQHTISPKSC